MDLKKQSWNKYRSEKTTQPTNKNLDDLFRDINSLLFHLKMVTTILQEILFISITCH